MHANRIEKFLREKTYQDNDDWSPVTIKEVEEFVLICLRIMANTLIEYRRGPAEGKEGLYFLSLNAVVLVMVDYSLYEKRVNKANFFRTVSCCMSSFTSLAINGLVHIDGMDRGR